MLFASYRWPSAEVLTRLVRRAQGNESRAVDELLETLRPCLLAFFQRRLATDTAEDLTQLALIRVSGAVRRIDAERADSYISTVARNVLRTAYRANARDRSRDGDSDPEDLPVESMTVDARVEFEDLVRAIHRACLTKIQPTLRDVALRVLDGESGPEIATALNISPITVRTRMMKVRAVLRGEVADYLPGEFTERREA